MDIVLAVAEREVVPGETARFPFTVRAEHGALSIYDFTVSSDNPHFSQGWAHIVGSSDAGGRRYVLEVRPANIRRPDYGRYPLSVSYGAPGTPAYAAASCTLVVKPCVHLTVKPALAVGPSGELTLSLENCGKIDIDVSVDIRHHGSGWSKGWEFELRAEDGPFEVSEQFDLPPDAKKSSAEFDLDISAMGISVVHTRLRPKRKFVSRKVMATAAAILLAGIAGAITIAAGGTGTAKLASQHIAFTSAPPAQPVSGDTYTVAASGGGSGNPVTFSIDPSSTSVCSISGSTVTFNSPGACVIDANQAGNSTYQAAPQAQQTVTVHGGGTQPISQSIAFTSAPPAQPVSGDTYAVAASGGGSGNPVTFSIDPSSTSVCSISGSTVTFNSPGTCVIDANQAGNSTYQAAPQAQQTVTVHGGGTQPISQSITFTSALPTNPFLTGDTYMVAASGGGSGNPVTFSIDPSSTSVCSISGSTVTFNSPGTCVIDANQAGNSTYQAAPQAQQSMMVNARLT